MQLRVIKSPQPMQSCIDRMKSFREPNQSCICYQDLIVGKKDAVVLYMKKKVIECSLIRMLVFRNGILLVAHSSLVQQKIDVTCPYRRGVESSFICKMDV